MHDTQIPPEPWDRQPGEPNLWYARFERYRLAGPRRSLLGAVNAELTSNGRNKQAKVPGAWNRAFGRWHWRERAEAWDEQERHQARAAHAREVDEMNRRHIQEAQALQNKAVQRLRSLELDELSGADVLRFLVEATKLERTARGEPQTIEERRLTGKGGGAVAFSLEEAVEADQELEKWQHEHLQPTASEALPQGSPQVP
jgi:hypothetical protein